VRSSALMFATVLDALIAFPSSSAPAANITVSPDNVMVIVDDEPTLEDIPTFEALTRGRQGQGVMLKSPGRVAIVGIRLGEIIRSRKMLSYVMRDTFCASACAIAWLGGVWRGISVDHAGVGFHGVYNSDKLQPSSAGNAVVGAFLGKIGLSDPAITYIMNPGANETQWLSAADARTLGIDANAIECRRGNSTFTSVNTGVRTEPTASVLEPSW
jgi:hypothetical protein